MKINHYLQQALNKDLVNLLIISAEIYSIQGARTRLTIHPAQNTLQRGRDCLEAS